MKIRIEDHVKLDVSRMAGRFSLAGKDERVAAGEALVAAAGIEHGLVNDGTDPLLVLVVVTPPPPHGSPASAPGATKR